MKIFRLAVRLRRIVASILFLFFLALLLTGGAPPAKALTLTYVGPAWDTSECALEYPGTGACIGGYVSGSATLGGVADNYTGNLTASAVTAWSSYCKWHNQSGYWR